VGEGGPCGRYGVEVLEEDTAYAGDDWWGEELADRAYVRCRFADVDLTEATMRSVRFEECQFFNVRFNASQNTDCALLRCTFRRCNLYDSRWQGCKLVGSAFDECELRPLTVMGGDWSFVNLATADLRGVVFRDVRMREADLTGANLTDATLSHVDLSGAQLAKVKLGKADLRGSDVSALNPRACEIADTVVDPDQTIIIALALGFTVRDDR
jgi:uncharacterized protein YjbI with pentapeptide repeats